MTQPPPATPPRPPVQVYTIGEGSDGQLGHGGRKPVPELALVSALVGRVVVQVCCAYSIQFTNQFLYSILYSIL